MMLNRIGAFVFRPNVSNQIRVFSQGAGTEKINPNALAFLKMGQYATPNSLAQKNYVARAAGVMCLDIWHSDMRLSSSGVASKLNAIEKALLDSGGSYERKFDVAKQFRQEFNALLRSGAYSGKG